MIGKKHLEQMRHAVGFFSEIPGFRNSFHVAKEDAIWNELKTLGFADGTEWLGSYHFWVTDEGKALIGLDEQIRFKERLDRRHERNIEDICETHNITFD